MDRNKYLGAKNYTGLNPAVKQSYMSVPKLEWHMDQRELAIGYLTLAGGHALLNDPEKSRQNIEHYSKPFKWYMRAKTAITCAAAGTAIVMHKRKE